jgi:phage shock protein A
MEAGRDGVAGTSEADRDTAERRLDELLLQYAAIKGQEERVAAASRRVQVEINAFRDAGKAIEAAYTAAEEAAAAVPAACQNEAENPDIER